MSCWCADRDTQHAVTSHSPPCTDTRPVIGRLKDCPCQQGVKAAQAGNRVIAMACAAPTQNSAICTGTSRAGVRGDVDSRPLHVHQHFHNSERLLCICQQHIEGLQVC